jgi:hypothetical protein
MSHFVTIDLPSDVAARAEAVAARTHRRVEEVLLEWLGNAATDLPVEMLSDAEVLALSDLQMDETDQSELGSLLAAQREGNLTDPERDRLTFLLDRYRKGMIRKAEALKVAVDRGLRPPLDN